MVSGWFKVSGLEFGVGLEFQNIMLRDLFVEDTEISTETQEICCCLQCVRWA